MSSAEEPTVMPATSIHATNGNGIAEPAKSDEDGEKLCKYYLQDSSSRQILLTPLQKSDCRSFVLVQLPPSPKFISYTDRFPKPQPQRQRQL